MRCTRSTGTYVLCGVAIVLGMGTLGCLVFTLDPADRLPSVVTIVVAIAAAVVTSEGLRRWTVEGAVAHIRAEIARMLAKPVVLPATNGAAPEATDQARAYLSAFGAVADTALARHDGDGIDPEARDAARRISRRLRDDER